MKKLTKIIIGATALATLALTGCAGSSAIMQQPQEVLDAFLAENPDLPALDKRAINERRITLGVQANTVLFLMGEPHTRETVVQPWATQERWTYRRGQLRIFIVEDHHIVGIDEQDRKGNR